MVPSVGNVVCPWDNAPGLTNPIYDRGENSRGPGLLMPISTLPLIVLPVTVKSPPFSKTADRAVRREIQGLRRSSVPGSPGTSIAATTKVSHRKSAKATSSRRTAIVLVLKRRVRLRISRGPPSCGVFKFWKIILSWMLLL